MSEDKSIKLIKAVKELNIGMGTLVDYLATKGYKVDKHPMAKLDNDMYNALLKEFAVDKSIKEEAKQISIGKIRKEEPAAQFPEKPVENRRSRDFENEEILIKNTGHFAQPQVEKPKPAEPAPAAQAPARSDERNDVLPGVKVVGKIDLNNLNAKPQAEKPAEKPAEVVVKQPEPVAQAPAPTPAPAPAEPKVEAPQPVAPVVPEPPKVETPKPAAPVALPVAEVPKAEEPKAPVAEKSPVATPPAAPETPVTPVADESQEPDVIRAKAERLTGPNIIGKIQLPVNAPKRNPVASSSNSNNNSADHKRKRKRKDNQGNPQQGGGNHPHGQQGGGGNHPQQGQQPSGGGTINPNRPDFRNRTHGAPGNSGPGQGQGGHGGGNRPDFRNNRNNPPQHTGPKEEPSEKDIQDQIKATLARLSGAGKSGKFAQRAKFRRQKRDDVAASAEELAMEQELQSKVLKVTEFVTANELASMMDVSVTQIISTCMSLGMFVSINQRLDAETLSIVADEFGYQVEFVKPQDEEANLDQPDDPADLVTRAPIVTIMGHVDHGKTSLLDFIRKTNVIGGEAGGITQHIGAYEVTLPDNKGKITFLDTPGHEAFTAMRARGAQVTDIVIIVIAADDSVMPQTREAINHAQAAGAPIIFAFNKIDKPGANADKVREQLSAMNILVEEWGGKYQSQEISAKTGLNVDLLLEKVLLEAELLELKANPNKRAVGTVIEAALDKGRGIVTTILVQAGRLKVGDPILAGCYSGRVKALTNERGQRVDSAGPSTPVQVLGMQGAPTAGDKFNALESEVEAREIANKRLQLQREQGLRTQKHITLDEIGRRLAVGNFKELNIIVKGDVDGSIEALSDSLLKLSTEQIQVNIISKAVGQISESDVLLASASDAIIIGFQVRPSGSARKLAEAEQIDIRLYSIIYDAINEIKAAMEGMLAPTFEEKIVANVEIRETFKISKVGTIAGCMVLDGKINRNSKIRIIRDGVVIYTGELASLKRFKDDVKEVSAGYECGLNINNFNNIEVGDIVEAYENVEVKRKL
ncbi:translation initiation factor IF-2 [Mucilaginibacter gossypii]|uniref:translation initiation factor IF-2 n=1 Tax=Mucilaginibacter gossypii TaxID=551996 RepID=UPI000DCC4116|nr:MULTISPECIES: translation initiation factor IF-2 [Mucilaginibacter]QTE35502.1 translation initiation factor IF-2 [Mucilaginibacter gossypii]RAV59307.1 translation initiation factor IF-2 [Mucilaginibacter rubeus]